MHFNGQNAKGYSSIEEAERNQHIKIQQVCREAVVVQRCDSEVLLFSEPRRVSHSDGENDIIIMTMGEYADAKHYIGQNVVGILNTRQGPLSPGDSFNNISANNVGRASHLSSIYMKQADNKPYNNRHVEVQPMQKDKRSSEVMGPPSIPPLLSNKKLLIPQGTTQMPNKQQSTKTASVESYPQPPTDPDIIRMLSDVTKTFSTIQPLTQICATPHITIPANFSANAPNKHVYAFDWIPINPIASPPRSTQLPMITLAQPTSCLAKDLELSESEDDECKSVVSSSGISMTSNKTPSPSTRLLDTSLDSGTNETIKGSKIATITPDLRGTSETVVAPASIIAPAIKSVNVSPTERLPVLPKLKMERVKKSRKRKQVISKAVVVDSSDEAGEVANNGAEFKRDTNTATVSTAPKRGRGRPRKQPQLAQHQAQPIKIKNEKLNSAPSTAKGPILIPEAVSKKPVFITSIVADKYSECKPSYKRSCSLLRTKIEKRQKIEERDDMVEAYSHDECLEKGRSCKRECDRKKDLSFCLEAVVYYLLAGATLELKNVSGALAFYRNTLPLVKFTFKEASALSKTDSQSTYLKMAILSLRCLSLLTLKLYKLRSSRCRQVISQCRNYLEINEKADTPSSISPSNSTGSQSSAFSSSSASEEENYLLVKQYEFLDYLTSSHEAWDEADLLVRKGNFTDFFIDLDRKNGSLTMHSTFYDVFHYVQAGLKELRKAMSSSFTSSSATAPKPKVPPYGQSRQHPPLR